MDRRLLGCLALTLAAGACKDAPRRAAPAPASPCAELPRPRDLAPFPPAPPDEPGRLAVLRYADFGPPSMAYELLGAECYAFAACSCLAPDEAEGLDVRVVVVRAPDLAAAQARFPSTPATGEYRIVAADRARAHLRTARADLHDDRDDPMFAALDTTLRATEERLGRTFPP